MNQMPYAEVRKRLGLPFDPAYDNPPTMKIFPDTDSGELPAEAYATELAAMDAMIEATERCSCGAISTVWGKDYESERYERMCQNCWDHNADLISWEE